MITIELVKDLSQKKNILSKEEFDKKLTSLKKIQSKQQKFYLGKMKVKNY